jgi:hypothetical protein
VTGRVAGGVALGAALCLGIGLLVALPANRLADGLVAHKVYAERNNVATVTSAETTGWVPSSFPDFGVTFSVPSSWFVYQRTEIYSMASQLGFVSTVPMLMGQRVQLPPSGGVFTTWTTVAALVGGISRAPGKTTTLAGHPARLQHVTARTGCRRMGGTREVLASIALTENPKDTNLLSVDTCLAGADRSLDRDVSRLLGSIAIAPR